MLFVYRFLWNTYGTAPFRINLQHSVLAWRALSQRGESSSARPGVPFPAERNTDVSVRLLLFSLVNSRRKSPSSSLKPTRRSGFGRTNVHAHKAAKTTATDRSSKRPVFTNSVLPTIPNRNFSSNYVTKFALSTETVMDNNQSDEDRT